jgi:hypothetical protein
MDWSPPKVPLFRNGKPAAGPWGGRVLGGLVAVALARGAEDGDELGISSGRGGS